MRLLALELRNGATLIETTSALTRSRITGRIEKRFSQTYAQSMGQRITRKEKPREENAWRQIQS